MTYRDRYLVSPVGKAVRWPGATDETVERLKERGWTEPALGEWERIYEEQDGESPDHPRPAA